MKPKIGFNFRTFRLHFWAPRLAKNTPLSHPKNELHMPQTTAQFAQLKGPPALAAASPLVCDCHVLAAYVPVAHGCEASLCDATIL